jgi:hypothetical protein
LESYTVQSPTAVGEGNAEVKLVFAYDGGGSGKGGQATLYVNGEQVADGRIEQTQPFIFSADETVDVNKDEATQVVDFLFEDYEDSEFTGFVRNVEVMIPKVE